MELGTNMKNLIAWFCSYRAVPKGGGIADGAKWFLDPVRMKQDLQDSAKDAQKAIEDCRVAGVTGTDEWIAGELLKEIQKKKKSTPR